MRGEALQTRRRLLVPEVVQTSAMDCGPAALKCLLEGFGIPVSYGRLREACQTDVDGTSIDTLEEVAVQLGLEAEQVMVPVDHLLLPEAQALPALVVVRLPARQHPLRGRVAPPWPLRPGDGSGHRAPLADLPTVSRRRSTSTPCRFPPLPGAPGPARTNASARCAAAWRSWDSPVAPRRACSMPRLQDPGWRPLATLDAATRMVTALVRAGGLRRGQQAARVLEACLAHTRARQQQTARRGIPAAYWSVRPAPPGPEGEEQLLLRGAVLVRIRGRRAVDPSVSADGLSEPGGGPPPLSPELVAALEEPPSRPGRELLRLLRADGLLTPTVLVAALLLAAAGLVVEALLLRGLFDLGRDLGSPGSAWAPWGCCSSLSPRCSSSSCPLLRGCPAPRATARSAPAHGVSGEDPAPRRPLLPEPPHLGHGRAQPQPAPLRLLPDLGGQLLLRAASSSS